MDDERFVRLARRGYAKRAGAFLLASGVGGGQSAPGFLALAEEAWRKMPRPDSVASSESWLR